MKKGLILTDEQIPFQISSLYDQKMLKRNPSYLFPIEEFIKDFQPDVINRLGDFFDFPELQGWTNKKPSGMDWVGVSEAFKLGNLILDRQDKLHRAKEKHFTKGNHDERLELVKAKNQHWWSNNRTWYPNFERDLKLKQRGYRVHGQNDLYNVGHLYFFHGDDWNTFHTKNNVANYEVSVVYGHVHAPQRFTKKAMVTHQPKSAWSLGCLCRRDPDWQNKSPNAWVNGFGVYFVKDDGTFNLYPIDIINGSFVGPSGKLYKL